MINETFAKIEARIRNSESLSDERKRELLNLLSTLKSEVSELSKNRAEDARNITRFAEASINEAMRGTKDSQVLKGSIEELSSSVEGFESSHPKLVQIVNSICVTLSSMGI